MTYFYALVGVAITIGVALKPSRLWPMVIVIAVGTVGLMLQEHALVDECLIAAALLGSILAIFMGAKSYNQDNSPPVHRVVFFVLIVYMIVQGARGALLWGDWRLMRWVIFYAMLGILSTKLFRRQSPTLPAIQIAKVVSWTAVLYFGLYVVHGVFAELFRGITRFDTQSIEWAGSSYAMFPLIAVVPAALLLLKRGGRNACRLGWAVWWATLVAAFYYSSRVGWLTLLGFIVISPLAKVGIRRTISLGICFMLVFSFFYGAGKSGLFFRGLQESVQVLYTPRESDLDRNLHLRAACPSLSKDWEAWLFGHGIHSHRFVLPPQLQNLYDQYLPGTVVKDVVRTTGFTALLVDTGLVGMFLLTINFLFAVREICIRTRGERFLFASALLVAFLWLFVSNIQDVMLFYILIMPSGLLVQLGQHSAVR